MSRSTHVQADCAEQRPDDFDDLYRLLWSEMVRLARLLTGSQLLGEEIAQEAFVGFLRADEIVSPRAYLRRSVTNLAINASRRAKREKCYLEAQPQLSGSMPEFDDVWPLIQMLPMKQRAVLVLRYYLDLPEAEIAVTLSCRPGTVKSRAVKGLARLRREIEHDR